MGFLDFFTIGNFKKSPKGHWLFFPYGKSWQGYIIDSERSYKKLRWQMTICLLVSLLLGLLILKIARMENLIYLLLLIPLLFGQHFLIYRLYRHMTPTDEKPLNAKSLNYQAVARHPMVRWLFFLFSFIVLIASIYVLFTDPDKWFLAVLGLVLFGFAVGLFIKMIISRRNLCKKGSSVN
jgi:Ca2+/Na+ antiporter